MAEQFRLSASFSRPEVPESAHSVCFLFYLFFSRNHAVFNSVEFNFPFPFLSFLFRRIPESAYPFRLRETDGKSVRPHLALVPLCVLLFVWLFVFFVSSPGLFVCLQDGGYGCVCFCGMTVLSVVLSAGEKLTDKASFFLFSRKIRYRVRGKYKGIRRDKKWCEAECGRII